MQNEDLNKIIELKIRGYNLLSIGYLKGDVLQYSLINPKKRDISQHYISLKKDDVLPSIATTYENANIFEHEVNQASNSLLIEEKRTDRKKWTIAQNSSSPNFTFKFGVSEDMIVSSEIGLGFSYRNIERNLLERQINEIPTVLHKICGMCSTGHTLAFCAMIERMYKIDSEIPERSEAIRVIVSEVERILNHLLWFGLSAYSLGLSGIMQKSLKIRTRIEDSFQKLGLDTPLIVIGGIDANLDALNDLFNTLNYLKNEITDIRYHGEFQLLENYTRGIGMISKTEMSQLGAVGPITRSSGIECDARSFFKYSGYKKFDSTSKIDTKGDLFSIFQVKYSEIIESLDMVLNLTTELPTGNTRTEFKVVKKTEITNSWVEAPSGILQYSGSIKNGRLHQIHINVPTINNLSPMLSRFYKSRIEYVPIILRGIDMGFDLNDQIIFFDINRKIQHQLTGFDLNKISLPYIEKTHYMKFSDLSLGKEEEF